MYWLIITRPHLLANCPRSSLLSVRIVDFMATSILFCQYCQSITYGLPIWSFSNTVRGTDRAIQKLESKIPKFRGRVIKMETDKFMDR